MHPNAPYFIILYVLLLLLYITPDNFTRQGEGAATQWVKDRVSWLIDKVNVLKHVLC